MKFEEGIRSGFKTSIEREQSGEIRVYNRCLTGCKQKTFGISLRVGVRGVCELEVEI